MTHTIIYFTGTGNSLAIARGIAGKLNGARIISAGSLLKEPGLIAGDDVCGLVFPVYCQDVPEIMKRAVSLMPVSASAYIYAVATHNGDPGFSHYSLDRILRKKGRRLQAGFAVLMPGNSFYSMNAEEEAERRVQTANSSIESIAADISARRTVPFAGSNSLRKRLKGLRNMFRHKAIYKLPKSFWVTDSCNRCGLCTQICPEENIKLTAKGPIWGNHCQMCLACIHWCPQQAVQNGKVTADRRRYHHPDVCIEDMIQTRY